jgi:predicted DNA-binding ribbon-helix-helix protein
MNSIAAETGCTVALQRTRGERMSAVAARQITLRLPEPLYAQVKRMARKRRVSVNRLMRERLESLAAEAMANELRLAYDALGRSAPLAAESRAYEELQSRIGGMEAVPTAGHA